MRARTTGQPVPRAGTCPRYRHRMPLARQGPRRVRRMRRVNGMRVRRLNRYVEETVNGSFMGMPFQGIGYTGYDNGKKQYVGTWIDNFGTGVMTSTGTSADNGKTYTFKSTGTDPMTGKDMPTESRVTVTDADHHTMEMWGPAPDGKMFKTMQIEYSRKK